MDLTSGIQTILVPKGAEYQAVCRGLRGVSYPPTVFSIPIGSTAFVPYLKTLKETGCLQAGQRVLVMGLCGGLSPALKVGMPVLYKTCTSLQPVDPIHASLPCDQFLTAQIQAELLDSIRLVTSITSDRVICLANDKQNLFQQAQADVVDMEGYMLLDTLTDAGVSVVMLRVVSDDCQFDLPDLTQAIDGDGSLKPLALASAMLGRPIAAMRLIRGSTQGLKVLQRLTHSLFDGRG